MLAWAVQAQNPWRLSALSSHHQPQAEPPSSQQRVQRSVSNRVQRSRSGGQRKLTASPGAQVKGQAKVSAGSWPPIRRHGRSGPSKGGSPRSSVTTWSDVTAPCQGAAEGLSLASEGPVSHLLRGRLRRAVSLLPPGGGVGRMCALGTRRLGA